MTSTRLLRSCAIIGLVTMASGAPSSASVYEEARQVCAARFADEQKSGSVPKGMSKSRYLSQCQNSYVRSVKLERELRGASKSDQEETAKHSKDGQGGPEILPPASTAKATRPKLVKPTPRFKPTLP